jgi:hypothetical protein
MYRFDVTFEVLTVKLSMLNESVLSIIESEIHTEKGKCSACPRAGIWQAWDDVEPDSLF